MQFFSFSHYDFWNPLIVIFCSGWYRFFNKIKSPWKRSDSFRTSISCVNVANLKNQVGNLTIICLEITKYCFWNSLGLQKLVCLNIVLLNCPFICKYLNSSLPTSKSLKDYLKYISNLDILLTTYSGKSQGNVP